MRAPSWSFRRLRPLAHWLLEQSAFVNYNFDPSLSQSLKARCQPSCFHISVLLSELNLDREAKPKYGSAKKNTVDFDHSSN